MNISMEKQELKSLLKDIKDSNYSVPDGINQYELSIEMMNYIGDIDSELRDDLILTTLYHWIIDGVLSVEEDYELLKTAIDDKHLFYGLGETNDTVFTRTFSAEIVANVIYKHRQEKFIPEADIHRILEAFLEYYTADHDIRGYVEGKGWAHGAAHGADALDEFARCEEIGYDELKKILTAIYKKVNVNHYGYIHFEDERMITAVKAVLERNLIPMKELEDWIDHFQNIKKCGIYPEDLMIDFNVNVFLKSLYFRLFDLKEYNQLAERARHVLKEISRFKEC